MENFFKNHKKIALLGLSIEGFSTLLYLHKQGVSPYVLDQKEIQDLPQEIQEYIKTNKVVYIGGQTHINNLNDYDLIVRSPGIPIWREEIHNYKNSGGKLTSHTQIFFDTSPAKIIGVTGTKGKGTTASLIYHMLKESGKDVYLGGNIGTPPLSFIDKLSVGSLVVLELSSFQLEDLNKSPQISVILNVTQDHLYSSSYESPNYHKNKISYINAKANILKFQKEADHKIIYDNPDILKKYAQTGKGKLWTFSIEKPVTRGTYVDNDVLTSANGTVNNQISHISMVKLIGKHNLINVSAAAQAAILAGATLKSIIKVISTFTGLEHRLEFVRSYKGIEYYNDSFSTTPETCIAALNSFPKPLILICGGSKKGSNYSRLAETILTTPVKAVILIGETAPEILNELKNYSAKHVLSLPKIIQNNTSMQEIIASVSAIAKEGDIVLLSPACASFGMFRNYKERGNLFKEHVSKLI